MAAAVDADVAEAVASQKAIRERQAELDLPDRDRDPPAAARSRFGEGGAHAATDGARSAAEARRVVAERFNVGVATTTEVLDAQVALLQAELDRTRALASIRLAEARLDRALGR